MYIKGDRFVLETVQLLFTQNLQNLVDRLCAAKDHYELQQGGAALLEQVRSNRELKKQNIQEKIDLLKKEKNIALSKVCASAMNCHRKNILSILLFLDTLFIV